MQAKIYVTYKESVLDPQGKAVKHSLETLGFNDAEEVRIGKYIVMKLTDQPMDKAKARVEEMCKKLLANTVIETYRFEIE